MVCMTKYKNRMTTETASIYKIDPVLDKDIMNRYWIKDFHLSFPIRKEMLMGASYAGAAGKSSTDMSGHVFEVSGVSVRFRRTEKR